MSLGLAPTAVTRNPEWVTIEEGAELIKGFYVKQRIYHWIHQKKLKRKGPFHKAMVRRDELLKVAKLEGIVIG